MKEIKVGDSLAHRGYLIVQSFLHGLMIQKDGHLICWADSIEDAKRKINELLD